MTSVERHARAKVGSVLGVVVLALTACATKSSSTATTTPSPTSGSTAGQPGTIPTTPHALRVYWVQSEQIAVAGTPAPNNAAVAKAAMNALLAGPQGIAAQLGMTTAIPTGTRLLGLTIANGTATVDLTGSFQSGGGSLSMQLRVAQIVYTLTQFTTVRHVDFKLDGIQVTAIGGEGLLVDGVDRATFEAVTPAVLVESPLPGDVVTPPLSASGTANTFEATVNYTLTGPGDQVIKQGFTTASSGSGTRGTFALTLPFTASQPVPASFSMYEVSAKDGSRIHVVKVPVHLEASARGSS